MSELLFSGIQPTSAPHLGNYIGALKQWTKLQTDYSCLFCVVDLHAITVPQAPDVLRKTILETAAMYISVGIDPERATIFIQSEVPQHTELAWIFSTITKVAELERMTQYKDKTKNGERNTETGLLTYPVLMAADILLYGTTVVPVGEDQVQHLELTRDIARKFNTTFGETFAIPKPLLQKTGARIMGLDDPTAKMSKSAASKWNAIFLTDDADTIRKKIAHAVTDSEQAIAFDAEKRPGLANLLTIFHHVTEKPITEIEADFTGKGYGEFKKALAEAIISHLAPIQERFKNLMTDPAELSRILDRGHDRATKIAAERIQLIKDRVGLGR